MKPRLQRAAIIATIGTCVSTASSPSLALEDDACKAYWNLAVLYMAPVKERLSETFRMSMKGAFFVMKNREVVKIKNEPLVRPCVANELREVVLEKIDDVTAVDLIEDAANRQKIDFLGGINYKVSENADKITRNWLASRNPQRQQQRVP